MEKVRALLNREEPVKWLFYGDSITHGAVHTFGNRDYPELFSERVRFELKRPMDIVINSAISGNTTKQLLAGFDWRVKQFSPTAAFLMIGMNDCSDRAVDIDQNVFADNLRELCDRFDELGTLVIMQTTCPILPGTAPEREPNFDAFMDKIREVAKERSLPLIDHHAQWVEEKDKLYYRMSNAFHPNQVGHREFAFRIFRELGIFDASSLTCNLFTP